MSYPQNTTITSNELLALASLGGAAKESAVAALERIATDRATKLKDSLVKNGVAVDADATESARTIADVEKQAAIERMETVTSDKPKDRKSTIPVAEPKVTPVTSNELLALASLGGAAKESAVAALERIATDRATKLKDSLVKNGVAVDADATEWARTIADVEKQAAIERMETVTSDKPKDISSSELVSLSLIGSDAKDAGLRALHRKIDASAKEYEKRLIELDIAKGEQASEWARSLANQDLKSESSKLEQPVQKPVVSEKTKEALIELRRRLVALRLILEAYRAALGDSAHTNSFVINSKQLLENILSRFDSNNKPSEVVDSIHLQETNNSWIINDAPVNRIDWAEPVVKLVLAGDIADKNLNERTRRAFHDSTIGAQFITTDTGVDVVKRWAEEEELTFLNNEQVIYLKQKPELVNLLGLNRAVFLYSHVLEYLLVNEEALVATEEALLSFHNMTGESSKPVDVSSKIKTLRTALEKELSLYLEYRKTQEFEKLESYKQAARTNAFTYMEEELAKRDYGPKDKLPFLKLIKMAQAVKGEPVDEWALDTSKSLLTDQQADVRSRITFDFKEYAERLFFTKDLFQSNSGNDHKIEVVLEEFDNSSPMITGHSVSGSDAFGYVVREGSIKTGWWDSFKAAVYKMYSNIFSRYPYYQELSQDEMNKNEIIFKKIPPPPSAKGKIWLIGGLLKEAASTPIKVLSPLFAIFAPLMILGLANPLKQATKGIGVATEMPSEFPIWFLLPCIVILACLGGAIGFTLSFARLLPNNFIKTIIITLVLLFGLYIIRGGYTQNTLDSNAAERIHNLNRSSISAYLNNPVAIGDIGYAWGGELSRYIKSLENSLPEANKKPYSDMTIIDPNKTLLNSILYSQNERYVSDKQALQLVDAKWKKAKQWIIDHLSTSNLEANKSIRERLDEFALLAREQLASQSGIDKWKILEFAFDKDMGWLRYDLKNSFISSYNELTTHLNNYLPPNSVKKITSDTNITDVLAAWHDISPDTTAEGKATTTPIQSAIDSMKNKQIDVSKLEMHYKKAKTLAVVLHNAFSVSIQPTAAQPTATQPTATQPTATQPTATQPTATQPTATQPTAAQSVNTKIFLENHPEFWGDIEPVILARLRHLMFHSLGQVNERLTLNGSQFVRLAEADKVYTDIHKIMTDQKDLNENEKFALFYNKRDHNVLSNQLINALAELGFRKSDIDKAIDNKEILSYINENRELVSTVRSLAQNVYRLETIALYRQRLMNLHSNDQIHNSNQIRWLSSSVFKYMFAILLAVFLVALTVYYGNMHYSHRSLYIFYCMTIILFLVAAWLAAQWVAMSYRQRTFDNDDAFIAQKVHGDPGGEVAVWSDNSTSWKEPLAWWEKVLRFFQFPDSSPFDMMMTERALIHEDKDLKQRADVFPYLSGPPWGSLFIWGGLAAVLLWSGWLAYREMNRRREILIHDSVIQARQLALAAFDREGDQALRNWYTQFELNTRLWLENALHNVEMKLNQIAHNDSVEYDDLQHEGERVHELLTSRSSILKQVRIANEGIVFATNKVRQVSTKEYS